MLRTLNHAASRETTQLPHHLSFRVSNVPTSPEDTAGNGNTLEKKRPQSHKGWRKQNHQWTVHLLCEWGKALELQLFEHEHQRDHELLRHHMHVDCKFKNSWYSLGKGQ